MYPDYLAERDYYQSIIASETLEPEELNNLYPPVDAVWVGDKPKVELVDETISDRDDDLDMEQE